MRSPSRALPMLVAAAGLTLTTACGSGAPTAPAKTDTEKVVLHGSTVTPTSKAISLKVGQKLVLDVTADKPGEIHVHSSPEQHIDYQAGHSTHALSFKTPGVVEIESHTLDKTLFQVEVR